MSWFEDTRVGRSLAALHRDEQGAEGLEKLLIIGAIVLPILGLLVFFRKDLVEAARDAWDGRMQDFDDGTSSGGTGGGGGTSP